MPTPAQKLNRRQTRNRVRLKKFNNDRPRLSVHRSSEHIYAQIIDDVRGITLAAASSLDKELGLKTGGNIAAATEVGKLISDRAKKAGVTEVVFDRGGRIYHGRVKALAEAAREAGLTF